MNQPLTDWKTTANPVVDTRATKPKPWILRVLGTRASTILLLDVALFIFFSVQTHGLFSSVMSIQAMLLTGTEALLLALGLALLLGAGVFDLSLGANLVLSSVAAALVMKNLVGTDPTTSIWIGLLAAVVTGSLFGLVNGLLVAYAKMNALIATLGTLGLATGLGYVLSNGVDIGGLPLEVQSSYGLARFGSIPVPMIVAAVLALVLFFVIRFTRFGMRTLAIGSSRAAAERVGIKVPQHLLKLIVVAGALAGLAGFTDIAHFAGTTMNGHGNDALNAVTAAVIGGTLLEGGRVSILGTIWGTALAVILQSGLVIIGVSSYYQLMAVGLVLIAAVGVDRFSSSKRKSA